jgi:hypothetical protein
MKGGLLTEDEAAAFFDELAHSSVIDYEDGLEEPLIGTWVRRTAEPMLWTVEDAEWITRVTGRPPEMSGTLYAKWEGTADAIRRVVAYSGLVIEVTSRSSR